MGGITECLRVASLAEHYNVVVSPHFLPALFIHVAGAAPSIRWMEDFPLLEPLFDKPVGIDSDGNITPRKLRAMAFFGLTARERNFRQPNENLPLQC